LSRMRGNSHVRFLGEGRAATLPPYPTQGALHSRLGYLTPLAFKTAWLETHAKQPYPNIGTLTS
jgi:hypothetical protein